MAIYTKKKYAEHQGVTPSRISFLIKNEKLITKRLEDGREGIVDCIENDQHFRKNK